jgi:hypothetical protein
VDVFYCMGKACPTSWVLLVFSNLLFACCVVLLRARQSDYKDRGNTLADGMFSVVGEIDDMFKKLQRFQYFACLRVMASYNNTMEYNILDNKCRVGLE